VKTFWRLVYAGFALVFILGLSANYINPKSFWPIIFIGLSYPYSWFVQLIYLCAWGFKKRKIALVPLVLLLSGFLLGGQILEFNSNSKNDQDLSIATYNFQGFQYNTYLDRKDQKGFTKKIAAVFSELESSKIDIICTQESLSTPFRDSVLIKYFRNTHGLNHHYSNGVSNPIISRYPIVSGGGKDFYHMGNSITYADLKIGGSIYRVINFHLQSNAVSDRIAETPDIDKSKLGNNLRGILRMIRTNTYKRVDQAKELADYISESPYPVIAAGDLNDGPQSFISRLAKQNLEDTFDKKGKGIGSTYRGKIPLLRIDRIFCDPSLEITSHQVLQTKESDHKPIIATIKLDIK